MAHRDESGIIEDLPVFYNVDLAVGGKGQPNRSDDVMLVQFMLREIYKGQTAFNPPVLKPSGNMVIDGLFGPITNNHLRKFQADVSNRGGSIFADGVADSVRGEVSSISETVYTLVFLNTGLEKVRPDFLELFSATDIPQDLAFRLF